MVVLVTCKSEVDYHSDMQDFDAHTVRLHEETLTMADTCMMPWPGNFNIHITSL